jgi:ABC-type transport system involved in multi-copper enzyme maturation permease subunit
VVARTTLLEALRNRLLLVTVAFAVVLVGLSVSAASVSIGEQSRLIIDVGLAAASAIGSVIAIAVAISSFAGEMRRRTAYPVLARPLPRWAFVLGKYLGVLFALEAVVVIMVAATAGVVWLYGDPVPSALWWSLWLTLIEMALVTALAIFFSTIASPVLAATYSVGVLLAGNLAGDILALAGRLEEKGKAFGPVLRGLHYLLPDLEALSVRSQAANHLPVPGAYLLQGTAYGACYAATALILAMWIFSRRRAL